MVSCVVEYKIGIIYSIDVFVWYSSKCVVRMMIYMILVVEVIVEIVKIV